MKVLLIAPVGIEIKHADRLHRRQCLLLIAPVGIEMKSDQCRTWRRSWLLIAPVGIEMRALRIDFQRNTSTFNRTSRN